MTAASPFTPIAPMPAGTRLRARLTSHVQETRHRWFAPAVAHLRARRSGVRPVVVRSGLVDATMVVVLVIKDEAPRLPFFLQYYRNLGVEHFLVVDNASTDDCRVLLADAEDVSLFEAPGDFKRAHFGGDWVNALLAEHCVGKWVSWIDADEFLVFTDRPRATLVDLAEALEREGRSSAQMLMLDMYSARPPSANVVVPGADPLTICDLFDASGYYTVRDRAQRAVWLKGGVRGRLFFPDPLKGPALNKSVMVRWRRHTVFLRVAHELWPYRLNGSGRLIGLLLHFKFTAVSASKMLDAEVRQQHTAEYAAYDELDAVEFVDQQRTRRYVDADSVISAGLFTPVV